MNDKAFKHADKQPYLNFIKNYSQAKNAASGSQVDANANVQSKTITTMEGEAYKKEAIAVNRLAMQQRLTQLFDRQLADQYIDDLENHRIYRHDETALIGKPYCASITMYPFILNGLKPIGGTSVAPKNLRSFCGGFVNLVFAVAANLAGAVATPQFLAYMDHFIRLEYGDDYYLHVNDVVSKSKLKDRTIDKQITDCFEQVVYCINQPAGARNYQSVFWNCAYFDEPYFKGMFEDFVFPDGDEMKWESVSWLQKRFMKWFNAERTKSIITFPVETMNLLDNGTEYVDNKWADYTAEMLAEGHSFFIYRSDSVDSLASCCRLRNEVQDNQFSYTLGAGGVSTGSKCVMTINFNRLLQEYCRNNNSEYNEERYINRVKEQVQRVHKYLYAFNTILQDRIDAKLIPIYDAGFVNPERCYLTVGINGLVESAQFLGYSINDDDDNYKIYVNKVLETIKNSNKEDGKTYEVMFNTQYVPAQNLGSKNCKWDRKDGYVSNRDCYNSYFYIVEDESSDPITKFMLHGANFTQHLDGGSALHCNLDEHLTKEQYRYLLNVAIKTGCPYFTFNVPNTVCRDCGHISKNNFISCPECHSQNVDHATRVIGYLKLVSSFSEARQEEASRRFYFGGDLDGDF